MGKRGEPNNPAGDIVMTAPSFTPRVFSGIQPSGDLHLGNYLGAIKRFVDMAGDDFETVYCMV